MKSLTLQRVTTINATVTFGVLLDGDTPLCLTLERDWENNQQGVSCIPSGTYRCTHEVSAHLGDVYRLADVPGRSDVLIHTGNVEADSRGCVILGLQYGEIGGLPAVLMSKLAMTGLMNWLYPDQAFMLTIQARP